MLPRFLLDTHIAIRWLSDPKRLSRQQAHALEGAGRRFEPLAFSSISLLESAVLASQGRLKLKISLDEFFEDLQTRLNLRVLPLTFEIARETEPSSLRRASTGFAW